MTTGGLVSQDAAMLDVTVSKCFHTPYPKKCLVICCWRFGSNVNCSSVFILDLRENASIFYRDRRTKSF